jgi:hypothetical protein
MEKIPERIAAVARFGLPAGLAWAVANYFATVNGGGSFDIQGAVTHLVGPLLAGWGVSSFAVPVESARTAFARDGRTMPVLESLRTIIEQFKVRGVPDSLSMVVQWGDESYALDWSKRKAGDK